MYMPLGALHHLLFDCATSDHRVTACIWRIWMGEFQRFGVNGKTEPSLLPSMVCSFDFLLSCAVNLHLAM